MKIKKGIMSDFQKNKVLVLNFFEELDMAQETGINQVLGKYTNEDYQEFSYRCMRTMFGRI